MISEIKPMRVAACSLLPLKNSISSSMSLSLVFFFSGGIVGLGLKKVEVYSFSLRRFMVPLR
jgi:hypothetical protein